MEKPPLCPRWDLLGAAGHQAHEAGECADEGLTQDGAQRSIWWPGEHPGDPGRVLPVGAHQDWHSGFTPRPSQLGRQTGSVGRSKYRAVIDWRVGSTRVETQHWAASPLKGSLFAGVSPARMILHWTKWVLILFLLCGSKCALQYPVWLLQGETSHTKKEK